jgi:hypothetical protein
MPIRVYYLAHLIFGLMNLTLVLQIKSDQRDIRHL